MPAEKPGEKKTERLTQLGKLIEGALARHGTSARAIAQRAGIGASHLSKVLKAKRSLNRAKLVVLSDLLGLDREKVLRLAGFGPVDKSPLDLGRVTLLRTLDRQVLNVVVTPRLYDGALFMWMMNQQPLAEVGVETQLRSAEWVNVPAELASYSWSVGLHSRTPSILPLAHWSYLCLYRGHALIARSSHAGEGKQSLASLGQQARKRGKRLLLLTIDQAFGTALRRAADQVEEWDVQVIPNPDVALESFVHGAGDLFLGGLPQRLALRTPEFRELISGDKEAPLLYSLHALVCSARMIIEKRPVLQAIEALWYETCRRLYAESEFRQAVFEGIGDLLERQGIEKHHLTREGFELLFSPEGAQFELFARSPAELFDAALPSGGGGGAEPGRI